MKTTVAVSIFAVMFVGATLVLTGSSRADSIRCGTRLVEIGDSAETLFEACGPPTYRVTAHYAGGETWYYNRGSEQFTKKVVTLGGKIFAIEDQGYGVTIPPAPRM
ncbi:MAG TPA: DUF2845 domain-containing protein [Syntrophobacteria bacterium]|nr:DUF2845 domain-containing protein [Syntrophobacteria bacterium]